MKTKIFLALIACFGLSATAQAATECQPVKNYQLKKPVSFPRAVIGDALRKIAAQTPYVVIEGAVPPISKTKIGAENVSGNLNVILDEMTSQTDSRWEQEGCMIKISDRKAADGSIKGSNVENPSAPAISVFQVNKGESLQEVLTRWTSYEGWSVSWDLDEFDVIELGERGEFNGPMKNAIATLAIAMASAGEKLNFTYHNGNKVVRVARFSH